jgi:hypothetical protein
LDEFVADIKNYEESRAHYLKMGTFHLERLCKSSTELVLEIPVNERDPTINIRLKELTENLDANSQQHQLHHDLLKAQSGMEIQKTAAHEGERDNMELEVD